MQSIFLKRFGLFTIILLGESVPLLCTAWRARTWEPGSRNLGFHGSQFGA